MGLPPIAAFHIALTAAGRAAESPRESDFQDAIRAAPASWVHSAALGAGVLRHRRQRADVHPQVAAALALAGHGRSLAAADPLGLALLYLAREIARLADDDALAVRVVFTIEADIAPRQCQIGTEDERAAGLATLRRIVETWPTDSMVAEAQTQGTVEHNLARALKLVGEQLDEARVLLERALTRVDRTTSGALEALTRGELASVLRHLARTPDGQPRAAVLLADAVTHARRSEALARTEPQSQVSVSEARRLRRRIEHALAVVTDDRGTLDALAHEVREAGITGALDPEDALLAVEIILAGGGMFPESGGDIDRILEGVGPIASRTGRLDPKAAYLLTLCLHADISARTPIRRRIFAGLLGLADPRVLGPEQIRDLRDAESRWLFTESDPTRIVPWIDEAIICGHRTLEIPTLSAAEQRATSSWIRQHSELALMRETEATPDTRAVRIDLMGDAAFRANSAFFGAGVTDESSEGRWRTFLYRARTALDAEAERSEPQADPSDPESVGPPWALMEDDGDGNVTTLWRDPHGAVQKERQDLEEGWLAGRREGWVGDLRVPVPNAADIRAWLHSHPTVGVLLAAPGDAPERQYVRLLHAQGEHDLLAPGELFTFEEMTEFAYGLSQPPRVRTRDDRIISVEELWRLPVEERQDHRPDDFHHEDIARADAQLIALLSKARPVASRLAEIADAHGLTSLRVLSRGAFRWFPWEAVPLADGAAAITLGERIALVHVPTLAPLGRQQSKTRGAHVLGVAGARRDAQTMIGDIARTILNGTERVLWAPDRVAELEREMGRASVTRFVAHGIHAAMQTSSSGIELDDDPSVPEPHYERRYQAGEARHADLRGAERVELWICEGASGLDIRGWMRGEDESTSTAASFLLAGAARVVAGLWVQPSLTVKLIGRIFALAPETHSAEGDARRLARAVRTARNAAATDTQPAGDRGASGELLGPVPREAVGSPRPELPVPAWPFAGWRVTARDRDC